MRRFFTWLRREPGLKLLSLAIALLLCAWRSNQANPIEERHFAQVAVEPQNLGKNLVLVTKPSTANIVLRGRRRLLDRLTQEHRVRPYVDCQGIAQPTWKPLDVEIELPQGVDRVAMDPPRMLVEIDAFQSATRTVRAEIGRTSPLAGYVADAPVLTQREAEVSGPRKLVSRVAYVAAILDLSGLSQSAEGEARLQPTDGDSQRVSGCECRPATVHYTVALRAAAGATRLPVAAETKGNPAEGWRVARVEVEPASASISGPALLVGKLADKISTVPVDVTGWKRSNERRVALVMPKGLTAKPGEVTVRVIIAARRSGP